MRSRMLVAVVAATALVNAGLGPAVLCFEQ